MRAANRACAPRAHNETEAPAGVGDQAGRSATRPVGQSAASGLRFREWHTGGAVRAHVRLS
jgi:hypothetical protein